MFSIVILFMGFALGGASAVYTSMAQVINGEFGKTILPL